MIIPSHQIRAYYTDKTIRVYQAYSDAIANSALKHNTFVSPPFKLDRMTWIKPSFLWMMYRSGWAQKDANQKRILAIDIDRNGFEWALNNSCLSHKPENLNNEEWKIYKNNYSVRIQWDPERNILLEPLAYRTIQIGLSKFSLINYVDNWIYNISDVTSLAFKIRQTITSGDIKEATAMLPIEKAYPYHF